MLPIKPGKKWGRGAACLLVVENNEYEEKHRGGQITKGHVLPLPETDYPNGLHYYKLLTEKPDEGGIGRVCVHPC